MTVAKEPLGKLYFNPDDVGALKCLVAAAMTKRKVGLEPVTEKAKSKRALLFTSANGNVELRDAFSIAWFLAHYDNRHANKGYPDLSGANIVQWNSFSSAEIRPFLAGLLKSVKIATRRDVASANQVRKQRLVKSLDVLNETLMNRKYLCGGKFTLADAVVAADLAPVLEPAWLDQIGLPLLKEIMKKHYVYVREWYKGVSSRNVFKQGVAHMALSVAAKKTPNEKGDPSANLADPVGKTEKKSKVPKGPDMTKMKTPLRVLCLHGYRQNETSFREKLGAFRKIVGKYVDFTFVTAPHHVLPMSNEDINQDQRGWWFSRENDYFKADDVSDCDKGFEESLDLVQKTFDLHGPFDGILGFSQGASLAALICLIKERKPEMLRASVKFNFAILISAFKSRSSKHAEWYETGDEAKVSVPTLHVMGYEDRVIPKAMSDELLDFFDKPNVLRHQGGHYVPAKGEQKTPYFRFLSKVNKICHPDAANVGTVADDEKVDENLNEKMRELNAPLDEIVA